MNHRNKPLAKVFFLVPTLIVAWLNIATPASAQLFTLSLTCDDPTVTDRDYFGNSVSLDGNRMLVGAGWDHTNGPYVGQAHLLDATSGSLLQTFDDPTVTDGDVFGSSVALDGDRVLIGAYGDDTSGYDVGQAHLFDVSGNLLQTLHDPTVTGNDHFGYSVALDGNRVLIGAPYDSTHSTPTNPHSGQAHLFDANSGNLLRTFDDPTPTFGDDFGRSVALDGNLVLIGANYDETNGSDVGQAHLFDANSGNLLRTFDDPTPTPSFDRGDWFGYSVALDGNRALIGAPHDDTNGWDVGQAHLFDTNSGTLLQTFDDPTVTGADQFGYSVALDGNRVLIGANGDDTNGVYGGQAHLFDVNSGSLLQTFDDPAYTFGDQFGYSVALAGNRVLIGAPADDTLGTNVGQAYLFAPGCDFNSDATCDIDDLNAILSEGPIDPGVTVTVGVNDQFDLTGDGVIDNADLDAWLAGAGTIDGFASPYKRGDANLDGTVDGEDFILWNGNKFTSSLLWDRGEFNGDGFVDGQDFILWNGNKFTSSDGVSAVPEPATAMFSLLGLGFLGFIRRR